MARMGRFMVGPFGSWMLRGGFATFFVPKKMLKKLEALGDIHGLDVQLSGIERAYLDAEGLLWLLIHSTAYDLVKHFRGRPKLVRRLACLWAMECRGCSRIMVTGLGRTVCEQCGGEPSPKVFWRDSFARRVSVGPCTVQGMRLTCPQGVFLVGEVQRLWRDALGSLYAEVLAFSGSEKTVEGLVEVSELPELGWYR
ncbi:MAG: hypothetical protein QW420_02980 [Candidatus Caldarchaeum sp.]